MRLIVLLLMTLMISGTALAQNEKGELVIPGKGIGEITIGTPYNKVIELLGPPLARRGQEQERVQLLKQNINPQREMRFFIGFEYCLEYNYYTNRTDLPVYTLYFKENKVIYMVLSSYNYDLEKCKSFGIDSQLFFGDDKDKIKKLFGKNTLTVDTKTETLLYEYPEKGISLFLQDNVIRAMYLYAPLNKDSIRKYRRF